MLLNKYIVVYFVFLFCSLGVSLLSAVVGLKTIFRWRSDQTPEIRHRLENDLYLCRTAMFIGALLRVMMVPLWFFMLQSLVPLIPGAMCLAGIHQAAPAYSWVASAMKLILPLFYSTWIIIGILDRKIMTQPFLRIRHLFLTLIIPAVLLEAFLDFSYLLALKPVKVTCCTALFDMAAVDIPRLLTESHWYFVAMFCVALAIQTALLLFGRPKRWRYALVVIFAMCMFITLPLGLHTRLSPLLLDAPFHHCIFCLLQNRALVLAGSGILLLAIYVSFAYGLIGAVSAKIDNYIQVSTFLKNIRSITLGLFAAGFLLLLTRTLIYLFQYGEGF